MQLCTCTVKNVQPIQVLTLCTQVYTLKFYPNTVYTVINEISVPNFWLLVNQNVALIVLITGHTDPEGGAHIYVIYV